MKIQERTGAGAGRSAAPAGPSVGERLPTPPRERKPALAALAVLLILVGALGATMLVLQAGDRIEVVKITEEIPAKVAANKQYQNAMKNSDEQNARIEHDRALEGVITDLLSDHAELFKQFFDNPYFRKWLADIVFAETYKARPAA